MRSSWYLYRQDVNVTTVCIEELFQVRVEELKDQGEFLFCVQYIVQSIMQKIKNFNKRKEKLEVACE